VSLNFEICSPLDIEPSRAEWRGPAGPWSAFEAPGLERLVVRVVLEGTKGAATEAGVSVRTLHRQLAKRGTTVRALVRRFRRERALRLLGEGSGLDEIAEALGFSGPSALARFCRRAFGRTAGELREELVRRGRLPHVRCTKCGTKCQ